MEILTRNKCPECNGVGLLTHGVWAQYYIVDEEFKTKNGDFMSEEQCKDFFQQRGFSKLPPEEVQCSECEGKRNTEQWVDVNTLIEQLNN